MKVLGLVGSYRKNGNTDILVKTALKEIENENIETKYIFLGDYDINDCIGCEGCRKTKKCVINDDMQKIYPLLLEYDAVILSSPTYFYNVTGKVKNFIDRLYCHLFFDDEDRSIWMGIHEMLKQKYAITIAICEQKDEADMGYTSLTMSRSLESVGYRVIENVKVLNSYAKGDVLNFDEEINKAKKAGRKLAKVLKLKEVSEDVHLITS